MGTLTTISKNERGQPEVLLEGTAGGHTVPPGNQPGQEGTHLPTRCLSMAEWGPWGPAAAGRKGAVAGPPLEGLRGGPGERAGDRPPGPAVEGWPGPVLAPLANPRTYRKGWGGEVRGEQERARGLGAGVG